MGLGVLSHIKKSWRYHTATQLVTLSVITGSFTVFSFGSMVHQNINKFLYRWGNEIKMSVYLNDDAKDAEKSAVEKFINSDEHFSKIRYISKKEAVEQFKQKAGEFAPGLFVDMDVDNPLPASFEASIAGGLKSKGQFDTVVNAVQKLKNMAGVDEVSYGQGWVENYASVLNVFATLSYFFVFILLLGGLFVIGNSIRSSIVQRQEEIAILELFGATKKMIILPYVIESTLLGTLAATFSLLIVYAIYIGQKGIVANKFSFWIMSTQIEFLSPVRIIMIVAAGALLGGFGAYLWARNIATGWAAVEE